MDDTIWKTIYNHMDDIAIVINRNFEIEDINKKGQEVFQLKDTSFHGKKCFEVICQNTEPYADCPLCQYMNEEKVASGHYITSKGKKFRISLIPIPGDNQKPERFVEMLHEVPEVELVNQTEKIQLFEQSALAMFIVSTKNIILEVNNQACRLFHSTRQELIGKSVQDITHPDDFKKSNEVISNMNAEHTSIQSLEKRYLTSRGETIFALTHVSPVIRNNKIIHYIAQVTDITEQKRSEQEARESRERYKLLSNITFEGVLIHDHGKAIDMNPAFARIFGYHPNELISKNLVPLLIEKDYHQLIQDNIDRKYEKPYEVVGIKKDGTRFPIELESRDHEYQGQMIRITAVRDLTERRKTQKALIESEEKFRSIFNLTAGLMCVADLKNAQFKIINPAFTQTLGYSKTELISKSFLEFVHPDDVKNTKDIIQRKLEKGVNIIHFENRYRCKDGTYRWFDWSSRTIVDQGLSYAMAHDITALKEMEQELIEKNNALHAQNEEYLAVNEELAENIQEKEAINTKLIQARELESLQSNISNAFILHDDDAFYSEVLDHFLSFMNCEFGYFGYIEDEENLVIPSLTRNIWDKCQVPGKSHVFPKKMWGGIWGESLLTKKTVVKNSELSLPQGHVQLKNAVAVPIINNNKLTGQIVLGNCKPGFTTEDAETLQHLAKYLAPLLHARLKEDRYLQQLVDAKNKAEESDRLKSSFLANMSHEIRTPLNGILGFTNLLTRSNDLTGQQKKRYRSIIEKSSEGLMQIINDILDFSRIEIGEMEVVLRDIELNRFLFDFHTMLSAKLLGKSNILQIQYHKAPDEIIIQADETRLHQVFNNLLNNAVKFTDQGKIEYGFRKIEGNRIYLFVSDTGIGIPADKTDVIFERFRQVEGSMNRQYGGNGLGLSIVKSLIELMNGGIDVQSEVNQGTVFNFYLPFKAKDNTEALLFKNAVDETNSINPLRLLIVEDDPVSLLFLRELLDEKGYRFDVATTGEEGLMKVKMDKYDVILMDVRLPDADGLEIVKEIRKFNREVKIIAQTAYALDTDEVAALTAGCNDFVAKPINAEVLLGKISRQTQDV